MLGDDRAILPGSYDPVTRGHLDVIRRAARLFSRLHVAILGNPEKSSLFSVAERIELLETELSDLDSVEVLSFEGLTVHLASKVGARWIVRGFRSGADATFELPMAHSNRRCGVEEVETLLLPTSPEVAFISSSLVRQIALEGGALSSFVTESVEKALRAKRRRA